MEMASMALQENAGSNPKAGWGWWGNGDGDTAHHREHEWDLRIARRKQPECGNGGFFPFCCWRGEGIVGWYKNSSCWGVKWHYYLQQIQGMDRKPAWPACPPRRRKAPLHVRVIPRCKMLQKGENQRQWICSVQNKSQIRRGENGFVCWTKSDSHQAQNFVLMMFPVSQCSPICKKVSSPASSFPPFC